MTYDELRSLYPPVLDRAQRKVQRRIDAHIRRFLALSPFFCLSTEGADGADVSPRGDAPGFVHVLDETTLAIPDWPGNNRLDSLVNLLQNPRVGLLFLIPGVDETLRVNGRGEVTTDLVERWEVNGKRPRTVVRVTVEEAYFHCAKALLRSKLWGPEYRVDRSVLPTYGQMLKDQIETTQTAEEIQASVTEAYRHKLY